MPARRHIASEVFTSVMAHWSWKYNSSKFVQILIVLCPRSFQFCLLHPTTRAGKIKGCAVSKIMKSPVCKGRRGKELEMTLSCQRPPFKGAKICLSTSTLDHMSRAKLQAGLCHQKNQDICSVTLGITIPAASFPHHRESGDIGQWLHGLKPGKWQTVPASMELYLSQLHVQP